MKKITIGLVTLIVLCGGYYFLSPYFTKNEIYDESPLKTENGATSTSQKITESPFKSDEHTVSGKALVISTDAGQILRMEDFNTENGPNLKVYLSTDLKASDFVDLGDLKATEGNVNYEIQTGTDLKKYNHVLIWCKDFKVLFGHADLI